MVREIQITTAVLGTRDMVEIVIADTGQGITAEDKEKLFLPYFSTKQRGTGLGTGDREPDRGRSSRLDSRGRKQAGGHEVHSGVAGRHRDGRGIRCSCITS